MKLEEDGGFVLRTWPLREADLIVAMYTAEHGKVRGVAHGACRPKSRWLGALEPLTEVALHWSRREGQDLVSFRDVSVVASPYHPPPDLAVHWTLAHVAALADALGQEGDPEEALHRLLGAAVTALRGGAPPLVVARYVEAWALRLTGVLPDVRVCASCGGDLALVGGTWSWRSSGLGCPRCAGSEAAGAVALPEDLAFLEEVRRRPPSDVGLPDAAVLRRVGVLLGQILRDLLGRELKTARFLDELERLDRHADPPAAPDPPPPPVEAGGDGE